MSRICHRMSRKDPLAFYEILDPGFEKMLIFHIFVRFFSFSLFYSPRNGLREAFYTYMIYSTNGLPVMTMDLCFITSIPIYNVYYWSINYICFLILYIYSSSKLSKCLKLISIRKCYKITHLVTKAELSWLMYYIWTIRVGLTYEWCHITLGPLGSCTHMSVVVWLYWTYRPSSHTSDIILYSTYVSGSHTSNAIFIF